MRESGGERFGNWMASMTESVKSILGKKLRMTQVFDDEGRRIPVTVVEAGPCPVLQVKTQDRDGYQALQIGFGAGPKTPPKARTGHAKKAKVDAPRWVREIPHPGGDVEMGGQITVGDFEEVKKVDVVGITKGRGFAGTIKRWGYGRGPASHGSKNIREPGSTGQGTYPGKVFKGKKMAGHLGHERVTVKNLDLVRIEKDKNLLLIRGAVPGPSGGLLMIRTSHGSQGGQG